MTIKDWVSILEKMKIINLVPPYSSNLKKRLSRTPKVYFLDTGLACRLQGWTSPDPMITYPLQGHLFENLVYAEIYKMNINFQLGWNIYHWRSRDGEEIDFLIQRSSQDFIFIEAKISPQSPPNISSYREVKKVFGSNIPEVLVCHQEGRRVFNQNCPIAFLRKTLIE